MTSTVTTGDAGAPPYAVKGEDNNMDGKTPSPPPSYSQQPPDLTTGLANLSLGQPSPRPTVDRCVAHLKLLTAFAQLRGDVGYTENLWDISDKLSTLFEVEAQEKASAQIREKRWEVYVARAVDRFEKWWSSIEPSTAGKPSRLLRQKDLDTEKRIEDIVLTGVPLKITPSNLPPLDVLMVWHAYMLNPRCYFEDCLRYGKIDLWSTGMPWNAVDKCIDNTSFDYAPNEAARQEFEKKTGLAWNNLDDPTTRRIKCPDCGRVGDIAWTTCTLDNFAQTREQTVDGFFSTYGQGFADKGMKVHCSGCNGQIDHELLRVQKFVDDAGMLTSEADCPMPGTILTKSGLCEGAPRALGVAKRYESFPNRLLKARLAFNELELSAKSGDTMMSIRDATQKAMQDIELLRVANDSTGTKRHLVNQQERVAVRRMMSKYWGNSSPFGLDLVGAVIRQGSFVEKMHSIDWIHSPALKSSMAHLIQKYERFFEIMKKHPGHVAVPTLDVDLAWHTHQLSPSSYYVYSYHKTQVFIDHDDKIDDGQLNTSFEWTTKQYQKMFGEVYSTCMCWYCEAIRDDTYTSSRHIFGKGASAKAVKKFRASAQTQTPHPVTEKNGHISAHNAVRAVTDSRVDEVRRMVVDRKMEARYQSARTAAKRKGEREPDRDAFYPMWGYPMPLVAMPYGGVLMAEGCYPSNPGCMNVQSGGAGNCAAGTCGGSVAAGSCASNATSGGCAGVSAAGVGGGMCGGGTGGGGWPGGCASSMGGFGGGCAGGGGGGGCGGGGGGGGGCGGGGGGC